ncbi:MAG: hypothetical protein KF734_02885 [Saprospiraceae bacterium]|nr:hypothetical protein [Saprospiraceae bacterium]
MEHSSLETNDLGSYQDLLEKFLSRNYQFVFFRELTQPMGQLALRHDIDFDTHFALRTAHIEAELGIKATYFFLLRSNFYNILSADDARNVHKIKELGHTVSIHFDPVIYDDFHEGLLLEADIFQRYFNVPVNIISLHRPNQFFREYDSPIKGIEHTYQSKYFKDIKYFSDSTGQWRFGAPTDSVEFLQGKSLHVLIHPVWWMVGGASNLDKLQKYFGQRTQLLKKEFFDNCLPFREIYAHV